MNGQDEAQQRPPSPVRAYLRKFYSHPDLKHTAADLAVLYVGTKAAKRLGNHPKLFRDLAKGVKKLAKRGILPKLTRRVGKTFGNMARRAERRAAGSTQSPYVVVEGKKARKVLDYSGKKKITTRAGGVLQEGEKTRARPKFTKKVPRPKKGALNLKLKKHYPASRSGKPVRLGSDKWPAYEAGRLAAKENKKGFIGPKHDPATRTRHLRGEQLRMLKDRWKQKQRTKSFQRAKRKSLRNYGKKD